MISHSEQSQAIYSWPMSELKLSHSILWSLFRVANCIFYACIQWEVNNLYIGSFMYTWMEKGLCRYKQSVAANIVSSLSDLDSLTISKSLDLWRLFAILCSRIPLGFVKGGIPQDLISCIGFDIFQYELGNINRPIIFSLEWPPFVSMTLAKQYLTAILNRNFRPVGGVASCSVQFTNWMQTSQTPSANLMESGVHSTICAILSLKQWCLFIRWGMIIDSTIDLKVYTAICHQTLVEW